MQKYNFCPAPLVAKFNGRAANAADRLSQGERTCRRYKSKATALDPLPESPAIAQATNAHSHETVAAPRCNVRKLYGLRDTNCTELITQAARKCIGATDRRQSLKILELTRSPHNTAYTQHGRDTSFWGKKKEQRKANGVLTTKLKKEKAGTNARYSSPRVQLRMYKRGEVCKPSLDSNNFLASGPPTQCVPRASADTSKSGKAHLRRLVLP